MYDHQSKWIKSLSSKKDEIHRLSCISNHSQFIQFIQYLNQI